MHADREPLGERVKLDLHRLVIWLEGRWDAARLARRADRAPRNLRITPYLGHGSPELVVVRGRVLDNVEPLGAIEGEGTWTAVKRTLARFLTDELPGVPLRVCLGGTEVETVTDSEGYFELEVAAGAVPFEGPWATGHVELAAAYRGITSPNATPLKVRVADAGSPFGVISDVDDTILVTGAQRVAAMIRQTLAGSALTRVTFPGTPELYRAFASARPDGGGNPVFYVSSSPWNLHPFLVDFVRHRGIPLGPFLLRDLLGSNARRTHSSHKLGRIDEVLALHPELVFVLIGDSGQHDPEIYAEVVRTHPGRVLAIYVREVRLDRGDRRVEAISDTWAEDVPFVLAADSAAIASHAAGLGLISSADARLVEQAVAGS